MKKLYKTRTGKLDGVCEGFANYFNIDTTLIRILFIVFTCVGGAAIAVYIICSLIMPREPKMKYDDIIDTKEYRGN